MQTTSNTMAGSTFIDSSLYTKLSVQQILTWRTQTYGDLKTVHRFTVNDILNMDRTNTPVIVKDMFKSITNRFTMGISNGTSKYSDYAFVIVDSCALCHYSLIEIISNLEKDHDLEDTRIILIASKINLTENTFKILNKNKDKYNGIRFHHLEKNMRLLSGEDTFPMENVVVAQTDIAVDNFILWTCEWNWLKKHGDWNAKGSRNEINDDAQLSILVRLNKLSGRKCFMISEDKGLLEKTRRLGNALIYAKNSISQSFSSSKRKYEKVSRQSGSERRSKVSRQSGRTN